MALLPTPTVDVEAPNGGRIVLRPHVRLERMPGLSRGALGAVVVLGAIFLLTSVNRLNHTDLWGHLNFGRWIVEHGRLPQADPFRAALPGQDFLNIPWLAQVLGYACHEALGLEGLVLAHALLVTLASAALLLAVRARGVSTGWAAAAVAASYVLALPIHGTIRPQLFGIMAFAATLYGVTQVPRRRLVLVAIPLVFALWANVHGSFPMGLAVLGCYALGHSWSIARCRGTILAAWADVSVRRAWWTLLLATAASCVNPNGVELLRAVAGFSGNTNLEGISEWRPMALQSLSGVLFFGSLLAIGVLLRESPRTITATEILLVLVFAAVALTAIRMLVWWALIWPWVVAPHAAAAWRRVWLRRPSDEQEDPAQAAASAVQRLVFAVVVVGCVVWWSPPTHAFLGGRSRAEASVLSSDTPRQVAEFMNHRGLKGRIFAPMDWADYLVWRTHGTVEPLVHSHVHLISPEVWQEFLAIDQGSSQWLPIAQRNEIRYLVLSRGRHQRLAAAVFAAAGCRLVYEDPQTLLVALPEAASALSGAVSRSNSAR